MTSILTGDLIGSRKTKPEIWLAPLQALLASKGSMPKYWEIYRGDQFQLEITDPSEALLTAIEIKALLRSCGTDVRIGVGLGEKTLASEKITQSNGPAFVRSGEVFESLKKIKTTLAIKSGDPDFDATFNLMLRLALTIMDHWPVPAATYVSAAVAHPEWSQEEMGQKLGISQAAVSRRRKRAYYDLILELDQLYRKNIASW